MPVDFDYSNRGYLLPEGCKDLIDVIEPRVVLTEGGCVVTAQLPRLQRKDIEIVVDGHNMLITARQSGGNVPVDYLLEVPSAYTIDQARATFVRGELRIFVPTAAA